MKSKILFRVDHVNKFYISTHEHVIVLYVDWQRWKNRQQSNYYLQSLVLQRLYALCLFILYIIDISLTNMKLALQTQCVSRITNTQNTTL